MIISKMNTSVDPCQDFHQYVCGAWLSQNVTKTKTAIEPELTMTTKENSEKFTEFIMQRPRTKWTRYLHDYFEACMDEKTKDWSVARLKKQIETLNQLFPYTNNQTNTTMGDPHIMSALADATALMHSYGVNVFFTPMVLPDLDKKRFGALYLAPATVFPSVSWNTSNFRNSLSDIGIQLSTEDIITLTRFDKNVTGIATLYSKTAKGDVHQPAIPFDDLTLRSSGFDWTTYFNATLASSGIVVADLKMKLIGATYFETYAALFQNLTPVQMHFYLVGSLIRYFQREMSILVMEQGKERHSTCLRKTNSALNLIAFRAFNDEFATPELRTEVDEMSLKIRAQMRVSIQNVTFLDDETRSKALEKEQKMQQLIGASPWVMNDTNLETYYAPLKIDDDDFIQTMISTSQFLTQRAYETIVNPHPDQVMVLLGVSYQANAFYEAQWNQIRIPAAILQLPLINPATPASIPWDQCSVTKLRTDLTPKGASLMEMVAR